MYSDALFEELCQRDGIDSNMVTRYLEVREFDKRDNVALEGVNNAFAKISAALKELGADSYVR